jgi:hypothetical protein
MDSFSWANAPVPMHAIAIPIASHLFIVAPPEGVNLLPAKRLRK